MTELLHEPTARLIITVGRDNPHSSGAHDLPLVEKKGVQVKKTAASPMTLPSCEQVRIVLF